MDFVDKMEKWAQTIEALGGTATFEPIVGKQFKIGYDEIRPLMRSAFQKDIRRGMPSALRWGWYLYQNDQSYAWATLHTIVVEDVGMADPGLCALMGLATLKNWRKRVINDDQSFFHGLVKYAVLANKNRAPCELSVLAGAINFTLKCDDPTDDDLLRYMFPSDAYFSPATEHTTRLEMYQAATYLRARARNGNDALLHRVLNALHEYLDDPDDAVAMLTWERPIDPMNNGVFALLCHRDKPGFVGDDPRLEYNAVEVYTEMPLAMLDQHTERGRTVFKRFAPFICKALKTDRTFIVEQTIGAAVFFMEGCLVKSHHATKYELHLQQVQQDAYLRKKHKGMLDPDELIQAIWERWDDLTQMRYEILTKEVVKSL